MLGFPAHRVLSIPSGAIEASGHLSCNTPFSYFQFLLVQLRQRCFAAKIVVVPLSIPSGAIEARQILASMHAEMLSIPSGAIEAPGDLRPESKIRLSIPSGAIEASSKRTTLL